MTNILLNKNEDQYDISFLVCTYNRASYVEACVKHLLSAKTKYSFEVIVRDNASEDNTKEIIEEIKDPRLRYVRSSENQGWSNFLEIGKLARGKIITWLSDEDDFEFCHLNYVLNTFRNTPRCNVLIGSITVGPSSTEVIRPESILSSFEESYIATLRFSGCGGVFVRRASFILNCNFRFESMYDAYTQQNFYQVGYIATECLDKNVLITTSKILVREMRHAPTTDNWSVVGNALESKNILFAHYYPESIFDRLHSNMVTVFKKDLGTMATIKIAVTLGLDFIGQIDNLLHPSILNILSNNYSKISVNSYQLHLKRKLLHYYIVRKFWAFFHLAFLLLRFTFNNKFDLVKNGLIQKGSSKK